MTKYTSAFALLFACLIVASCFYEMAEAGKKKRLLKYLLLGASMHKTKKIIPLPLPLPLPIPILTKQESIVPVPEPYPVPRYVHVPQPVL